MNIKEEIKAKIENDVLQKEIDLIEKQLSLIIKNRIQVVLKSKTFQREIEQMVEDELGNVFSNSLEDVIGYKEYNSLILNAVKSVLKY